MSRKVGVMAAVLMLSACTSNMVKLGVYQNKAQLIGTDGRVYAGTIVVNEYTNDGEILFDDSPYGKLSGKWTATSHGGPAIRPATVTADAGPGAAEVPARPAYAVPKTYYGKTFLVANDKVALQCDFKANIEGEMLLGSVFVIGNGECLDTQKQTVPIQFFKS